MLLKKIIDSKSILPLFAFCIAFAIYSFSLAPTYLPPDGAEFALCIQYIGICHPPGFFLYILLGKLFTSIFPFGSLIYKTNLLSAIYAAGTILFIYLIMLKLHVSKNIAFVMALIFAVTSSFWYFALSADVFTFATLLLSITIYLLFCNKLYLSFFFLGLLTSHFPNSIILLPILSWYCIRFKKKKWDVIVTYIFVFLLGFLPFIVLLFLRMLQDPIINWGHVMTIRQFFDYLSRKEFGGIFLVSNPAFVFTVSNIFSHIYLFFFTLLSQFGWILPIIACFTFIKDTLYKKDELLTLLFILLSLICINIFSLSSIDPFVNKEFQFDKFYLSIFTIAIILFGVGINKLKDNGIKEKFIVCILIVLLLSEFLINWNSHNLSSNYFSKNMIENSLDELSTNAIVITTSNQNFFESWYEQLQANKYTHLTLVYFPNNTNEDYKKYHPELFSGKSTGKIEARVKETNNSVYKALLKILAKNATHPIYIWQGDLIDPSRPLFQGLSSPYGLWWRINSSQSNTLENIIASQKLLTALNTQVTYASLTDEQRFLDLTVYSSAYLATGNELASIEKYVDALFLFNKALLIDPTNPHNAFIQNEITTINEIDSLAPTSQSLESARDEVALMHLAQDYYTLGNYNRAIEIYKKILLFEPENAEIYSNIGAIYAITNDKKNGLFYFNKALTINPTLEFAIQGKNKLDTSK